MILGLPHHSLSSLIVVITERTRATLCACASFSLSCPIRLKPIVFGQELLSSHVQTSIPHLQTRLSPYWVRADLEETSAGVQLDERTRRLQPLDCLYARSRVPHLGGLKRERLLIVIRRGMSYDHVLPWGKGHCVTLTKVNISPIPLRGLSSTVQDTRIHEGTGVHISSPLQANPTSTI